MRGHSSSDTLTTAQAAEQLGVAPNSVMAWADAGLLQAWRTPGGHRRISAASVRAMIEARGRSATAASAEDVRVLLVEDNPDTEAVLSSHLKHLIPGIQLQVVRDGFLALLEAGRNPPDLLVTDINLPGMNGIAMIHSLQSQAAALAMRFILVSNYQRHELGSFGVLPPGVPLLNKPVSVDTLREAVQVAMTPAT